MKTAKVPESVIDAIKEQTYQSVAPQMLGRVHLSVDAVPYPAGHVFRLVDRRLTVRKDSALAFVDENPGANWGHPCIFRFHDPKTGALMDQERALFPPSVSDPDRALEDFHAPLTLAPSIRPKIHAAVDWRSVLGVGKLVPFLNEKRYALLWTSQISNRRHVEDLELMWRTLVDVFGFAEEHVMVLCYDGTVNATDSGSAAGLGNWVGDGTPYRMQVRASATTANLQAAFDDLAGKLKPSDLLLIHTNNHGAPTGLCVDNSSVLTPAEFGMMLAGLPSLGSLVVMMEQCYSGAFLEPTLTNSQASKTMFSSAVPANKVSAGAAHFDPYARLWIEALRGSTAYGAALPANPDANVNGRVSMLEAFQYARAQDVAVYDDPQYADSPAGCGAHVYLGVPPFAQLLESTIKYLERIKPGPIPLPDPGPERILDRATFIEQGVAALARSIGTPHR